MTVAQRQHARHVLRADSGAGEKGFKTIVSLQANRVDGTFNPLGVLQMPSDGYNLLSPLDPHAFFYDTISIVIALLKRDFEGAVAVGRAVSELNPAFSSAYRVYLSALGHLGRADEVELVRNRLLALEPDFTIRHFQETTPFERGEDVQHIVRGLTLAGVPA